MRNAAFFLALCLAVLFAPAVRAAEYFAAFHSDIVLARDGKLTVTETITANVEGNRIRRGIYRDFPLTFVDAGGREREVGFKLLSVERDGRPEEYRTERSGRGIRIYFGSSGVLLDRGMHVFRLTYETTRQIRFFDGHDELYWNVTGTEWEFPIERATASVTLPEGVVPDELAVFTGAYGATARNARADFRDGKVEVATTSGLAPHEGLTVAVKLPAGSVDRPSAADERAWFFRDNRNILIAFAGLVLVGLYYMRAWLAAGRDPPRGVVVPRWDAPDGISPALVNYIDNKGFGGQGWTALSAALLNLAVKGFVTLEDLKQSIVVIRTQKPADGKLPTGEAALIKALGASGTSFSIDKANGKRVQALGGDFRGAMEKEHRGKYYVANWGYIVGGVVLSVAAIVSLFLFGSLSEDAAGFIVLPVFAGVFLSIFAVNLGRSLRRSRSLAARIASIAVLAFIGFVFLTVFGGILVTLVAEGAVTADLPLLAAVGGIVLLNLLFFFLMGAPTPIGRKMMDGIEGLRQYLTLAEKERMNMAGAPEMSPRHFETLLPYAVALGVEKPWSETFERWLAVAAAGAATAAAYHPAWYHGDGLGSGRLADRMGGFAGSMADTLTSSLPAPPKSSSSGFSTGGGFSGGGGGGGGGGGW
ncbi:MAG: DUF2207 domain-containing protein [Shinella sp.]|nr:DUF2207 domain-containing protein [Shinella sp.]